MMRAPAFWDREREAPGLAARVLAPLAWLYGAATARRLATGARWRAPVPVICVGNINAGGTGKTPTVIALIERIRALGCEPAVVSRGYGGRLSGPALVTPGLHGAADVGDEPLLLAGFAPVWVSRDRAAGVCAAAAQGAGVLILDDGFQNAGVAHDLSLVVVDAARGFGNGRVIPAGPLREPLNVGLARADLLLSIGPQHAQARFSRRWGDMIAAVPHVTGQLRTLPTGMAWQGLRALAFAGIGDPEKFFSSLRAEGVEIVCAKALRDHQPLSGALMTRLAREARALGAQLVTTEKDAVRLPPRFRGQVLTLPVRLEITEGAVLDDALRRCLGQRQSGGDP